MMSSNVDKTTWQPDANIVKNLQSDIAMLFKTGRKSLFDQPTVQVEAEIPEPKFIEECAKIGTFLMNEQAVLNQLKRLNDILDEKIKNGATNNVYLLRQTLEEELGKLGFHPNLGKVIEVVGGPTFRAAIAHRLLLKDPPLGDKAHGEFTHALQWLAIAWQQEDSKFLDRRAVDVFKELGEEKSVYYRETLSPDTSPLVVRKERSLWDFIVDSIDRLSSVKFRRPENLHIFLRESKEKDLSTLTSLLMLRVQKRKDNMTYDKYSDKKLSKQSVFKRKDNREPYKHSNSKLPNILTPKNISIDIDDFNKRSSTPKKKK